MNAKFFPVFFLLVISFNVFSQEKSEGEEGLPAGREEALNVYLDCEYCDKAYFRENFTLINYVRDRKVSDVHVIVSRMRNGGGGREYTFQFLGQGRFQHLKDTLIFNTKADDTKDEIREKQLETLKKGLVPFMLKTPFAGKVKVEYIEENKHAAEKDPWHNWVFNMKGNAWASGEKSYDMLNMYFRVSANRITEAIKHQTFFYYNYSENHYRQYDSNDILIYTADVFNKGFYGGHSTVWSLGEHWGAGIDLHISQSTFSNVNFGVNLSPAIEYNVYKYSEASRKQLRFGYQVSAGYRDYYDTTIYNKTNDYLVSQNVDVNFKYITNWGSIRTGIYWQNYLHDFSLYRISSDVSMNIRIFKGLSFNIFGSLSMPRNQIGLVKAASTQEDVLLRQRELATKYSYYTSVGLSYTFGSIYNNVVNPRLD